MDGKLSFAAFVKEKRGAVADEDDGSGDDAGNQDKPFKLLTDEELVAENLVRRAPSISPPAHCQCVFELRHENGCAVHVLRRAC